MLSITDLYKETESSNLLLKPSAAIVVGPKSGKWLNEIRDREISSTRDSFQTSFAVRTETYSSYLKST